MDDGKQDGGEKLAAAMIAQTTEAIAVLDASGTVILANGACCELFQMSADELHGANIVDHVHPDDLNRAVTVVAGVTGGAKPRPGLIKVRHSDGSWMLLEISAAPIVMIGPDGVEMIVTMLLLRDNLFQETHWNFLAALSGGQPFADCIDILASGLSDGPDGPMAINYSTFATVHTDRAARAETSANDRNDLRSFAGRLPARLAGLTEDGLLDFTPGAPWTTALETGQPAWSLVDDLPTDIRQLAIDRGLQACVVVPVPDPGHDRPSLMVQWPQWTTMAEVLSEALVRRPFQALSLALERRFAMNRLEHLAHHDGLTGLVNRERFFEILAEHQAAGTTYAVFYIDLDRFKPINDTLGHLMGDRVIAACAHRLRHLSRSGDVVGRLGGDEFAIGCIDMDIGAAETMASRIVEELAVPISLSTTVVEIGASVGCSVSTSGQTADTVVAIADAALYAAKRAGRNRWARQ